MLTTAWVKPPAPVSGQDHLATMAPAVALYTQLVPGITNVTQRARAYSFYPWLLWAVDQAALPRDPEHLVQWLRRAECLWCLVGLSHGEGEDIWEHGAGIAGRDSLKHAWERLAEGQPIRLSKYATREDSEHRYFKPKLGGLGQYYLGTLSELRIVSDDSADRLRYDEKRATALAEALSASVDGNRFLRAIQDDSISRETLARLAAFCPCHLRSSSRERQLLRDLFFNASGPFWSESDEARPKTLGLLLRLAIDIQHSEMASDEGLSLDTFRAATYTRSLAKGRPWVLPKELEAHRQLWAVYEQSELLSLAAQGVFWASLAAIEESATSPSDSRRAATWFAQRFANKAVGGPGQAFGELACAGRRSLPELGDWLNPEHEVQRAKAVIGSDEDSVAGEIVATLCASVDVLLALLVRDQGSVDPYQGFTLDPDYFTGYPVNLISLRSMRVSIWERLTAEEWLAWLVSDWCLDLHFRVALRKLRYESKDTFRVRPGDAGLEVVEATPPAQTAPRINAAMQILRDLGLLQLSASGRCKPTAAGVRLQQDLWP